VTISFSGNILLHGVGNNCISISQYIFVTERILLLKVSNPLLDFLHTESDFTTEVVEPLTPQRRVPRVFNSHYMYEQKMPQAGKRNRFSANNEP
jgi:hypothetical protein